MPAKATRNRASNRAHRLDLTAAGSAAHPIPRSAVTDMVEVKNPDEKKNFPAVHHAMLRAAANSGLAMSFSGFTPLPARLHARLKYVSSGVALSAGVTPGVHVFSANGLYDPDITGTGHQPRGFDQLIALYDHYVVLKSKCKVEFSAPTSNTLQVVGVEVQATSTAQSDYIDYTEQPQCTFSLGPYFASSGAIDSPKVHEITWDAKKFMGIPDPITATKLQGSVSANPADGAFFHVFNQSYEGSVSATIGMLTSIEYDVVFIEPVPVASS
jgi:hypothetical protein